MLVGGEPWSPTWLSLCWITCFLPVSSQRVANLIGLCPWVHTYSSSFLRIRCCVDLSILHLRPWLVYWQVGARNFQRLLWCAQIWPEHLRSVWMKYKLYYVFFKNVYNLGGFNLLLIFLILTKTKTSLRLFSLVPIFSYNKNIWSISLDMIIIKTFFLLWNWLLWNWFLIVISFISCLKILLLSCT